MADQDGVPDHMRGGYWDALEELDFVYIKTRKLLTLSTVMVAIFQMMKTAYSENGESRKVALLHALTASELKKQKIDLQNLMFFREHAKNGIIYPVLFGEHFTCFFIDVSKKVAYYADSTNFFRYENNFVDVVEQLGIEPVRVERMMNAPQQLDDQSCGVYTYFFAKMFLKHGGDWRSASTMRLADERVEMLEILSRVAISQGMPMSFLDAIPLKPELTLEELLAPSLPQPLPLPKKKEEETPKKKKVPESGVPSVMKHGPWYGVTEQDLRNFAVNKNMIPITAIFSLFYELIRELNERYPKNGYSLLSPVYLYAQPSNPIRNFLFFPQFLSNGLVFPVIKERRVSCVFYDSKAREATMADPMQKFLFDERRVMEVGGKLGLETDSVEKMIDTPLNANLIESILASFWYARKFCQPGLDKIFSLATLNAADEKSIVFARMCKIAKNVGVDVGRYEEQCRSLSDIPAKMLERNWNEVSWADLISVGCVDEKVSLQAMFLTIFETVKCHNQETPDSPTSLLHVDVMANMDEEDFNILDYLFFFQVMHMGVILPIVCDGHVACAYLEGTEAVIVGLPDLVYMDEKICKVAQFLGMDVADLSYITLANCAIDSNVQLTQFVKQFCRFGLIWQDIQIDVVLQKRKIAEVVVKYGQEQGHDVSGLEIALPGTTDSSRKRKAVSTGETSSKRPPVNLLADFDSFSEEEDSMDTDPEESDDEFVDVEEIVEPIGEDIVSNEVQPQEITSKIGSIQDEKAIPETRGSETTIFDGEMVCEILNNVVTKVCGEEKTDDNSDEAVTPEDSTITIVSNEVQSHENMSKVGSIQNDNMISEARESEATIFDNEIFCEILNNLIAQVCEQEETADSSDEAIISKILKKAIDTVCDQKQSVEQTSEINRNRNEHVSDQNSDETVKLKILKETIDVVEHEQSPNTGSEFANAVIPTATIHNSSKEDPAEQIFNLMQDILQSIDH